MLGLGFSLTRIALAVRGGGLSSYAVNGLEPALVTDYVSEYYRTSGTDTTFDSAITFGGGLSTMTDSDGLLKWCPHNYLKNSEDASAWTLTNVTQSANATFSDASVSAFNIVQTSSGSGLYRTNFPNPSLGAQGTIEVYLKYVDWQYVYVMERDTNYGVVVDLQNGTLSNVGSSVTDESITDEGNGWYLIKFTVLNLYFGPYIGFSGTSGYSPTITGDGSSSFGIAAPRGFRSDLGGMVDNPDRGDSYVPTTTAARYLPRRGHHIYNGSTWVNHGIRHESEARTNLLTYSEDFTDASWIENGSSASLVSITAPDGSTQSVKITEDGTTGVHQFCGQNVSGTSAVVVASGYFKAAEYSTFQLTIGVATSQPYANFDLSSQTVSATGNGGSGLIEEVGNGWYRCSLVCTPVANGSWMIFLLNGDADAARGPSYTGDGTSGIYIYGAQLEAGSTPSSYIPTTSATVTRAAETLTIAAADLPFAYNPVTSKARLVNTFGWTITDGGAV